MLVEVSELLKFSSGRLTSKIENYTKTVTCVGVVPSLGTAESTITYVKPESDELEDKTVN